MNFQYKQVDSALQKLHPEIETLYELKREPIQIPGEIPTFREKVIDVKQKRDLFKSKRKISRTLVKKCSSISHLKYASLFTQLSDILNFKQNGNSDTANPVDDEDILAGGYNYLGNAFGEVRFDTYHKILKDYDYILKNDPSYRDHLFHTFHVFLIGCKIIDDLYDELSDNYQRNNTFPNNLHHIEYSWLLISNFHDIGIPIQHSEKMILSLTSNFFSSIDTKKKTFDILSLLDEYDRKLMKKNIKEMLSLTSKILKTPLSEPELLGCRCHEQLYKLNHAILGSTFLVNSMSPPNNSEHFVKKEARSPEKLSLKDINLLGLPIFIHDFISGNTFLGNRYH
jgi:hypothetical protein